MSEVTLNRGVPRLGILQIVIILLAVITAVIHLDRGITSSAMMSHFAGHAGGPPPGAHRPGGSSIMAMLPVPLPILFYLNFLAYIVLAAALYLPALYRYRNVIRWLLIALAALTIIMWFLITGGNLNILSYIDKPVEVALIVLLFVDMRQEARLQRS